MAIVTDSTPLHYLILIGEIDLLRKLYGRIVIPNAVIEELSHSQTPVQIREWIGALPSWASTCLAGAIIPQLARLGPGEREALTIAQRTPASIVLTDDLEARGAAESLGIQTVPTIRVLSTAAALGLIDFRHSLARLSETNFRVSRRLMANLLNQHPVK